MAPGLGRGPLPLRLIVVMGRRPLILHVHPGRTSFVAKDARLLAAHFTVVDRPSVWRKKWQTPFLMLEQALRIAFDPRWDAIVVQFAGFHSLLPAWIARIRRRPCLIITGGMDCVSFPSLHYGNFARQPLAWATRASFRSCTQILPVHRSLMRSRNTYQRNDPVDQGVLSFMPDLIKPTTEIFNGYAADRWPLSTRPRPIDVITVASNDRRPSSLQLKGVSMLMRIAHTRPHLRFRVIGLRGERLADAPANMEFLPPVANNELPDHYGQAKVYAQLSLSEGFPNALCEAMLCGCTPLVSEVAAMPMIVDGIGQVVHTQDVGPAALALDLVLERAANGPDGAARARIAHNYTEDRREEMLAAAVSEAIRLRKTGAVNA